jgi:hypothetical protein
MKIKGISPAYVSEGNQITEISLTFAVAITSAQLLKTYEQQPNVEFLYLALSAINSAEVIIL